MKKDKDKLAPLLRAFKNGDASFDYAIEYILDVYTSSNRFNPNSFIIGLFLGGALGIFCSFVSIWGK